MRRDGPTVKRIILLAAALCLALTACGGGTAVGDEDILNIDETFRASPSPTPTPTRTRQPSPTPTRTQTQAPPQQETCPAGQEIELRIKTLGDGFQWRFKGEREDAYRSASAAPFRVAQGCSVSFTNEDPARRHSWISGDNGTPAAGQAWSSPALPAGESWLLDTSRVPAGRYSCHDGEVPYIVCSAEIVAVR